MLQVIDCAQIAFQFRVARRQPLLFGLRLFQRSGQFRPGVGQVAVGGIGQFRQLVETRAHLVQIGHRRGIGGIGCQPGETFHHRQRHAAGKARGRQIGL